MRLIDADLLKAAVPEVEPDSYEDCENCDMMGDIAVRDLIDAAQTVDAVPVVRCKGCKHAERYERTDGTAGYYCGHPQNTFVFGDRWDRVFKPVKKPDDFCSYGQRRGQSADVRNMDGGGADAPCPPP